MNDDIKVLSMLLRYSQRHMVVSQGLIQAHFLGDAETARAAMDRLELAGLVYLEGVTVRLTLPGFAHAVRLAAQVKAVQSVQTRRQASRKRAA